LLFGWLACLLTWLVPFLPSPRFILCPGLFVCGLLACLALLCFACLLALWLAMEIELKNPREIENKNRKIGYPMLLPSATPESPLNEQPESTLNNFLQLTLNKPKTNP
jgi:hypothetical protein